MSTELLRPPVLPSTHDTLHRSQLAPRVLSELAPSSLPYPLSLLFESDSPEKWNSYENLFYSCLRTGDNASAARCIEQLQARFGLGNERVMGLMGMYQEAVAKDDKDLELQLSIYREFIKQKPTNLVIRKRLVALLKSMGRTTEAVSALMELLDISPVDAESWAELAELYFVQRMYAQAVYCYEDVLLTTPNAWNIHARLAEILYISATSSATSETLTDAEKLRTLLRCLKSYSRSLELCDDYLRGFYGLHLVSTALLSFIASLGDTGLAKMPADEDFPTPSLKTVQKLKELATKHLAEIVRKHNAKASGWEGYDGAEIAAARALLDKDGSGVAR